MEGTLSTSKQEIHQSFTETWTWCTNTAIITTETSALRAALLIQNANGDFVFAMKVGHIGHI